MWTLSWKPGEVLFTKLTKLLRFKLNQITGKKVWEKQAYHVFDEGDFNQAHQETLAQTGLQCFWGRGFQSGLPGNSG